MLKPNNDCFHQRIEELAQFGWTNEYGVVAMEGSDANRQAREKTMEYMRAAGLEVSTDKIGNIIGIMHGSDPGADDAPVIIGSHVDTVSTGGKWDGRAGVLAALEAVENFKAAGENPRRTIVVAAFTGEEGTRFQPSMMGSKATCRPETTEAGLNSESILQGEAGITLRQELERIGHIGDKEPGFFMPKNPANARYLELHIEQGPVLEQNQSSVAAVNAIYGNSQRKITVTSEPPANSNNVLRAITALTTYVNENIAKGSTRGTVGSIYSVEEKEKGIPKDGYAITFTGEAGHAGTCPMDMRKDAVVAASNLARTLECAQLEGLSVSPKNGAVNVVPGNATLTISAVEKGDLEERAQQIASQFGLKVEIKTVKVQKILL